MIPPSLGFIVYGIMMDQSIGRLFIAGILPGIMQVGSFLIAIYLLVRLKPDHAPLKIEEPIAWMEKIRSLEKLWPILLLFLLVMGGIYLGWFTANESAAIGAAGALLLALLMRRLTWREFEAVPPYDGRHHGDPLHAAGRRHAACPFS